jgi:hypothetical protein
MVRLSYLLANRCAVLSERSADAAEDESLADGVAFADYPGLCQRVRTLVATPRELGRLAARGFERMRARPAADYLRVALAPGA